MFGFHIKYTDNSELYYFIPESDFTFEVTADGHTTLTLHQKPFSPIMTEDIFFVTLLYTNDPFASPKGLIINLGYWVMRFRLMFCELIPSETEWIFRGKPDTNTLCQWKLPLRIPNLRGNVPERISDLAISAEGNTKYEFKDLDDGRGTVIYSIPQLRNTYKFDNHSFYNGLIGVKSEKND